MKKVIFWKTKQISKKKIVLARNQLLQLIDTVTPKTDDIYLIGHSYGGLLSMHSAIELQNNARFKALIVLDNAPLLSIEKTDEGKPNQEIKFFFKKTKKKPLALEAYATFVDFFNGFMTKNEILSMLGILRVLFSAEPKLAEKFFVKNHYHWTKTLLLKSDKTIVE